MRTIVMADIKRKKAGFFKRLFCDLYEVTIWFKDGRTRQITLTELKKINQNYLKGVDEDGNKVEFKTEEKFDYYVKKIY